MLAKAYLDDICFRILTSFSTDTSSNVCSENAAFLRVCRHVGQGAGPNANRRSIQLSHLIEMKYDVNMGMSVCNIRVLVHKHAHSCKSHDLKSNSQTYILW